MKSLIVVLFSLALTGCSWLTKPDPVIQIVKVPVPVKCEVKPIDKPIRYFDQAKKENSLFDNTKFLAAENETVWAYSSQLEAALSGCTK